MIRSEIDASSDPSVSPSFQSVELPKCLNRLGGDLTSGKVCWRCTIAGIAVDANDALGLEVGNSTSEVGWVFVDAETAFIGSTKGSASICLSGVGG